MVGLSAYSRYLEELINIKHNKILFAWHGYLIHANGSSFFGVVPQIPSFIALILLLGYQFHITITELDISTPIVSFLIVLLAMQSILIVIMLYFCGRQYHSVLNICKNLSNLKPGEKAESRFLWKILLLNPQKKNHTHTPGNQTKSD